MCGPFHSTVLQHDATFAIFSTGQAVLPGRTCTCWSGPPWSGCCVTFAENPAPRGPGNPSARADFAKYQFFLFLTRFSEYWALGNAFCAIRSPLARFLREIRAGPFIIAGVGIVTFLFILYLCTYSIFPKHHVPSWGAMTDQTSTSAILAYVPAGPTHRPFPASRLPFSPLCTPQTRSFSPTGIHPN